MAKSDCVSTWYRFGDWDCRMVSTLQNRYCDVILVRCCRLSICIATQRASYRLIAFLRPLFGLLPLLQPLPLSLFFHRILTHILSVPLFVSFERNAIRFTSLRGAGMSFCNRPTTLHSGQYLSYLVQFVSSEVKFFCISQM